MLTVCDDHAYALVRAHGEPGWTARLATFTVDWLMYASSRVMLAQVVRSYCCMPILSLAPRFGDFPYLSSIFA